MAKEVMVILVDEEDRECGTMEKLEAHRKAVLHRAVSVFITNTKGEWLLQRRALTKYHSKALWSNTCCSHPYPEETAKETAMRRLPEEMKLYCDVNFLFKFIYKEKLENQLTEHELDHVFFGVTDDLPVINEKEVMDWKYVSYADLISDINRHPDHYTVWFREVFENVYYHIALAGTDSHLKTRGGKNHEVPIA